MRINRFNNFLLENLKLTWDQKATQLRNGKLFLKLFSLNPSLVVSSVLKFSNLRKYFIYLIILYII